MDKDEEMHRSRKSWDPRAIVCKLQASSCREPERRRPNEATPVARRGAAAGSRKHFWGGPAATIAPASGVPDWRVKRMKAAGNRTAGVKKKAKFDKWLSLLQQKQNCAMRPLGREMHHSTPTPVASPKTTGRRKHWKIAPSTMRRRPPKTPSFPPR